MLGSDAYLRLHAGETPLASLPVAAGGLVFVDLDATGIDPAWVARRLRQAPPGFFASASEVLVRVPFPPAPIGQEPASRFGTLPFIGQYLSPKSSPQGEGTLADLQESIASLIRERALPTTPVRLVGFPLGDDPVVVGADGDGGVLPVDELLARARRVEFAALLDIGRGIWSPHGYHYRLPSGEHASSFVRVADALQRPRDAVALATWLHQHARDRLGVVADSGTMVPLIIALHAAMQAGGLAPGRVATLTDYPANQFEVLNAVRDARDVGGLLALLSVSSSGEVRGRLADALLREGVDEGKLEVLVDRTGRSATRFQLGAETRSRGPWLGLSGASMSYQNGESCALCRDPDRARVVPIDPRSFEAMVLPEPDMLMPSVPSALRAKALFEAYDRADSVGVECAPHPRTQKLRPRLEQMALRFYPHDLLAAADAEFAHHLRKRLELLPASMRDFDVVVAPADDCGSEGFLRLVDEAFQVLSPSATPTLVVAPHGASNDDGLRQFLVGHRRILLVSIGCVTGGTMQGLLVRLHDVTSATLAGLVLHARPAREREWTTLRNAFSRRLEAIFRTNLPWRSVLEEEIHTLDLALEVSDTLTELDDAAKVFIRRRQSLWEPASKEWRD